MSDTVRPRVGIVMGSASDLSVMQPAGAVLDKLGIANEIVVASAHRTPDRALRYARQAEGRGIRVIIAGAGGAAHLAGVIAAVTPLPVIGVPVRSASLNGLDSLLSMVQMPPGVPVATVAIDGAHNAGILAAQILGAGSDSDRARVAEYKRQLSEDVERQAAEKGLDWPSSEK